MSPAATSQLFQEIRAIDVSTASVGQNPHRGKYRSPIQELFANPLLSVRVPRNLPLNEWSFSYGVAERIYLRGFHPYFFPPWEGKSSMEYCSGLPAQRKLESHLQQKLSRQRSCRGRSRDCLGKLCPQGDLPLFKQETEFLSRKPKSRFFR